MYLIDIKDKETISPVIVFNGRLENYEAIRKELLQMLNSLTNTNTIIIDLGGVESISDECLMIFSELANNWQLRFIKYSLFIEDKLKTAKLIEKTLRITVDDESNIERL